MKKKVVLISILLLMFSFKTNVFACSDDEILKEANKVTLNIKENKVIEDLYSIIEIDNISDKLYVVVEENYNNTKNIYYGKENNSVEIKENYIFKNINYSVKVYSDSDTCKNETLVTLEGTTKKYNTYVRSAFCAEEKNKNEDICDPFYDSSNIYTEDFKKIVEKKEFNNKNVVEKTEILFKKYGLYFVVPFVILFIFYFIMIKIAKNNKNTFNVNKKNKFFLFLLIFLCLINTTDVNAQAPQTITVSEVRESSSARVDVQYSSTNCLGNCTPFIIQSRQGVAAIDRKHSGSEIGDIYCLEPTLEISRTINLSKEFSCSDGFSLILSKAKETNASYFATLIAVRMYSITTGFSSDDGWLSYSDIAQTNVFVKASLYRNTAANGGVGGWINSGGTIYGGELSQAFELYNYARSNASGGSAGDTCEVHACLYEAGASVQRFIAPCDGGGGNSNLCKKVNNKYYDSTGREVDEDTYKKDCGYPCRKVNGIYYDNNANPVTKEEFDRVCGPDIPSPSYPSPSYPSPSYPSPSYPSPSYPSPSYPSPSTPPSICTTCKCEVKDGVYYDDRGQIVAPEVYQSVCFPSPCDGEEAAEGNCSTESIINSDLELNCESTTTGKIEDPQFCAIIGDGNCKSEDNNYLLANDGNPYCKLYTREKFEYKFMPKIQAIAGRYFVYDIETGTNNNNHKWLSTITTTKEVLSSNIKFNTWKKDLEDANQRIKEAYDQWQYWKAIYRQSLNGPSQITSDRPSCNTVRDSNTCCDESYETGAQDFCDWSCVPWQNRFTIISDCRQSSDYDSYDEFEYCTISNCSRWDTEADYGSNCSQEIELKTYTWTATYINSDGRNAGASETRSDEGSVSCPSECEETTSSNCSSTKIEYDLSEAISEFGGKESAAHSEYDAAIANRERLIQQIKDCNLYPDSNYASKLPKEGELQGKFDLSLEFEGTSEEINNKYKNFIIIKDEKIASKESLTYDRQENMQENEFYKTYCSSDGKKSCDTDISEKIRSGSTECAVDVVKCEDGKGCWIEEPKPSVPCNTAAFYTGSETWGYYQAAKIATSMYYGEIELKDNINEENRSSWLDIEEYSFPVNVNATNVDVTVTYSVNSQKNTLKLENAKYLCTVDLCNETTNYSGKVCPCTRNCICDTPGGGDPNNHCCKEGVICPTPEEDITKNKLGFYFRVVDLNNLFPNDRPAGRNWQGSRDVIEKIENNGNGNDIWLSSENSQYSVVLTSENRKNIRDYNKTKISSGYMDNSLTCNSDFKCKSSFLKLLTNKRYADKYNSKPITNDIYNYDSGE